MSKSEGGNVVKALSCRSIRNSFVMVADSLSLSEDEEEEQADERCQLMRFDIHAGVLTRYFKGRSISSLRYGNCRLLGPN